MIRPALDRAWTAEGGIRQRDDGAASSERTAAVGGNLTPAGNNVAEDPLEKVADEVGADIPLMARRSLIPLVANTLCWEDDSAFCLLSWAPNSLL